MNFKKYFKGDSELSIQILLMVIFGFAVAVILYIALAGKKTNSGSAASSFESAFLISTALAIFISNQIKKYLVLA